MRKYRASILMFAFVFLFVGFHYYSGWQDYVIEAEHGGHLATHSEFFWRWAKESVEGMPTEFFTLAIELALFAGIFQMFKPYDEESEQIKRLEEGLHQRIDSIEERL